MMHACRLFYLQVVKFTLAVVLHIKRVEEEGDVAVLWCLQDDGAVHATWVDVRPARTLQVAVFLFIGSATACKPPPSQSEHFPSVPTMLSVSKPIVHFSLGLFLQEKEPMKTVSVFCGQRHRDSVSGKMVGWCKYVLYWQPLTGAYGSRFLVINEHSFSKPNLHTCTTDTYRRADR